MSLEESVGVVQALPGTQSFSPEIGTGASSHARELAKRRVTSTVVQTPTTPLTPVALSTPVLAAHVFSEGNIMEDLQLAAELGKTLLERNKELENTIREQRTLLDDKSQEIEYLSKQTAALREVNDSRLRIYEQLEISIQELENSNQRLTSESNADKKKIKSLSTTVEHLEAKCDELEKCLDDSKALQRLEVRKDESQGQEDEQGGPGPGPGRYPSPTKSQDGSSNRKPVSYENFSRCCEDVARECMELQLKLETLEAKFKTAQEESRIEIKRREDLEIELECTSQETAVLREQLTVLKERENNFKSFEDELASVEDTSSSRICRKCMGLADDTGSSITMQDFTDELEDLDSSYDAVRGECALVKYKNGGYALGSQESLASMGQVVNCMISNESSPRTNGSEAPNSLLSELDTQYRILIEKYEALLEAREKHELHESLQIKASFPQTIIDSGVDEMSGPMSIVTTNLPPNEQQRNVSVLCQRCATCSCDLKLATGRPKSNMEEHSEVETSSSGFSEGETRLYSKMTQTDVDILTYQKELEEATTPTPVGNNVKTWDLQTPMNPCESRFQTAPVYRKIFHEIFEVLKKDVDKENENENENNLDEGNFDVNNSTKEEESKISDKDSLYLKDENEENRNPNIKDTIKEIKEIKPENITKDEKRVKESQVPRPDFLDLDSSSRCSSRSRRKKKHHKHRQTINSESNDNKDKENSEVIPHKNICDEKVESPKPPAPVNTAAFVNPLPNVISVLTDEKKYDEPQGPLSNTNAKQRCVHKRRKHKRSHKSQSSANRTVTDKNNAITHTRCQANPWLAIGAIPAPQNLPSVQVAKLIKFERTYAEVLKSRRA